MPSSRRARPKPKPASRPAKSAPKSSPAKRPAARPPAAKAKPKSSPAKPKPEPEVLPPPRPSGRIHVLSLSFVRDGDEFLARMETDSGQITELKNRSLDQLLTLVASELEDLLE